MPDLLSHLIIGLLLAELLFVSRKSLVVLGAILPDLIAKLHLLNLFYPFFNAKTVAVFYYMHNFFPLFLLSILISYMFKFPKIKTIIFITIGLASHFLLDATTRHLSDGALFAFLWPDQYYFVLIGAIILYGIMLLFKKILWRCVLNEDSKGTS